MRNKYLVVIMMLTFAFSSFALTACGTTDKSSDDMVQGEDDPTLGDTDENAGAADESGDVMGEFRNMMSTSTNPEDLYSFYDTNASSRKPEELDEMIGGIFSMVSPHSDVDFSRLSSQSENMSDEMRNYVNFMAQDQESPFVDEEGIHASLDELLEHCYTLEAHMDAYQNGVTYPYAYEKYKQLLNTAITGGFDEKNGVSNNYVSSDNANVVDDHAVTSYAAFIEKYPDSKTAKILTEYMHVLTDNNKEMNDNVREFYRNAFGRFDYYFTGEGAQEGDVSGNQTQDGTTNEGLNTTDETQAGAGAGVQ